MLNKNQEKIWYLKNCLTQFMRKGFRYWISLQSTILCLKFRAQVHSMYNNTCTVFAMTVLSQLIVYAFSIPQDDLLS